MPPFGVSPNSNRGLDGEEEIGLNDGTVLESPRTSLLQHVENLRWSDRDLEWLYLALKRTPIHRPNSRIRVCYTDEEGSAQMWTIRYKPEASITELKQRLFKIKDRISAVFLWYKYLGALDMRMVDLLWTVFDIDLGLLRDHLDVKDLSGTERNLDDFPSSKNMARDGADANRRKVKVGNTVRCPLQGARTLIQLRLSGDCLSAQLQKNTGKADASRTGNRLMRVVVMLIRNLRDSWEQDSRGNDPELYGLIGSDKTHFWRSIYSFNDRNWDVSTDPIHFLCPLIGGLSRDFWTDRGMWDPNTYDPRERPLTVVELSKRSSELFTFRSNLEDFTYDMKASDAKTELEEYIRHCRRLEERYDMALRTLKDALQQKQYLHHNTVLREQLTEAQESKASAIAVTRLTKLAFIFIPLSFSTSLLGMNLTLFGSGTIPIWGFFVVAAVVAGAALIPFVPSVRRMWRRLGRTLSLLRTGLYLAAYSPWAGIFFLLLYFTHGKQVCQELRIAESLERIRRTNSEDEKTRAIAQLRADWSDFRQHSKTSLTAWTIQHGFWASRVEYLIAWLERWGHRNTYFPKRWGMKLVALVRSDLQKRPMRDTELV